MIRPHLLVLVLLLFALPIAAATPGDKVSLHNDRILRELEFDGTAWKTIRIARPDGSSSIALQSDEFLFTTLNNATLTLDNYHAASDPTLTTNPATSEQSLAIHYALNDDANFPDPVPTKISIHYLLSAEGHLHKFLALTGPKDFSIDRLEVERFSIDPSIKTSRGGRGEPVFITTADSTFFTALEYPAAYSRHSGGNIPAHGTGPYDKIGNYSFISLDHRDVDSNPRPGLIRLFHFPGQARPIPDSKQTTIISKTSIIAAGAPGDSPELAFKDFLDRLKRPTRSFIHYNNWYHPEGKNFNADNFINNVYLPFKSHLDPYGVKLHAMVPDDGWQNRKSIYEPNPKHFPNGLADLTALSQQLQDNGTHLGLWIALNGYNSDIDWGVAQGYTEAKRNDHFKKFKRYYSITDPKYFSTISQRLKDLITKCNVQYFKHDFNEMCDLSDKGHLPTDRHGHEASVDIQLSLLKLERELNPDIYQNVTNWIWLSPFWLAHANNLWMLSSDTGEFSAIPEFSTLIRAAAYRDVHLHKIYHDPQTRPLVPISNLMTHGIIYTKTKYAGPDATDTLRDFSDYVMMYYTRGTQLKEWYMDPHLLSKDQWEILGRATRWSEENLQTLANTVKVGGDPGKCETYGYFAWLDDHAILTLRNPSATDAEVSIPFDQSVWYRGPADKPFHGRVIYPYQSPLPTTFTSGHPIKLTIPAYTLLTLDLSPGPAPQTTPTTVPAPPTFTIAKSEIHLRIPNEDMQRADLLLIDTSKPTPDTKTPALPEFKLNGEPVKPTRTAAATTWSMISLDLRNYKGQALTLQLLTPNTHAHLLLDRPVPCAPADNDPRLPFPISQGFRRQSLRLAP